jgi:BirA family transcriptional regulator, biotin operon repressor / biotin---[acetyl-CoA-carboxylase] ligase
LYLSTKFYEKRSMETLFTGRNLVTAEITASTNNSAMELLANSEPIEGTAILTEYQQHGKGQRGSSWISQYGANLLVSYIFYPKFLNAQVQFYLNIMASLATAQTLSAFGVQNIFIKWPNDLYSGDRKIAGILIENSIKGSRISSSIIGIGININQSEFPEFPVKATSMTLITGREFNKIEIFEELSNNLEKNYLQLKNGNKSQLKEEYLAILYRKNKFHTYESNDKLFAGKILSVTDEGKLVIETDTGEIKEFKHKVRFLS